MNNRMKIAVDKTVMQAEAVMTRLLAIKACQQPTASAVIAKTDSAKLEIEKLNFNRADRRVLIALGCAVNAKRLAGSVGGGAPGRSSPKNARRIKLDQRHDWFPAEGKPKLELAEPHNHVELEKC
jgi:hypothetical protein